ncbi:hypothetical protein CsSME_00000127 [Camellia sinensis var. sinensis]
MYEALRDLIPDINKSCSDELAAEISTFLNWVKLDGIAISRNALSDSSNISRFDRFPISGGNELWDCHGNGFVRERKSGDRVVGAGDLGPVTVCR